MKKPKLKIGVTACGGNMVSSALLSLKRSPYIDFEIYAFNSTQHEISQNIADHFALLPEGSSPEYADTVMRFIKKFNIDVFMPWSDEEAQTLSVCRDEVTENGCVPLVSSPETLNLIRDKAATYDKLKAAGLDVPEYTVVSDTEGLRHAIKSFGYPEKSVVIKPATGRGGRGVKVLVGKHAPKDWIGTGRREERCHELELHHLTIKQGAPYLVMPCLDAPVYDVDILRLDGQHHGSFVRQRDNPTGIPYTGSLLKYSPDIEQYARKISEVLDLHSLHDLDMMTDPKTNQAVLLEVNPRPSGSLAGLNAAGCNLLEFALARAVGISIPIEKPTEDKIILTFTESLCIS